MEDPAAVETGPPPGDDDEVTWSLVAVDLATGVSGVAVASCVPLDVLRRVPGVADGAGALVTQSYLLDGQRDRGVELLRAGHAPADVLAALLDPAADPEPSLRQIAIVGLDGRVAAATGADALPFAGSVEVRSGSLVAAVQGNLLTGPEVLDEAARAFASAGAEDAGEAPACALAERLLRGLEAGGGDGRGDARCVPLGPASQSASLRVGDLAIEAGVGAPGEVPDPLASLRSALDAWRADGRCRAAGEQAATTGTGGAGGTSASSGRADTSPTRSESCAVGGAPELVGALGLAALLRLTIIRRRCPTRTATPPRCSASCTTS